MITIYNLLFTDLKYSDGLRIMSEVHKFVTLPMANITHLAIALLEQMFEWLCSYNQLVMSYHCYHSY